MLLCATLAVQLALSAACFINNCPHGGKRSSAAEVVPQGLRLPPVRSPFQLSAGSTADAPYLAPALNLPEEFKLNAAQEKQLVASLTPQKRFLASLTPQYRQDVALASRGPPGTCFIPGVCAYPDCCSFERCAQAAECRVLKRGYRILIEYILSKLKDAGPEAMPEGTVA